MSAFPSSSFAVSPRRGYRAGAVTSKWAAPVTPHFPRRALNDSSSSSSRLSLLTDASSSTPGSRPEDVARQSEANNTAAAASTQARSVAEEEPQQDEADADPVLESSFSSHADEHVAGASSSPGNASTLSVIAAILAARGAGKVPGRRLSAFMQEKLETFSREPEGPPELDPEHRATYVQPPLLVGSLSAAASPILQAQQRSHSPSPVQSPHPELFSPDALSLSRPPSAGDRPAASASRVDDAAESSDVEVESSMAEQRGSGMGVLRFPGDSSVSGRSKRRRTASSGSSARKSLDFSNLGSSIPVLHGGQHNAAIGTSLGEGGDDEHAFGDGSLRRDSVASAEEYSVLFDQVAPSSHISFGMMPAASDDNEHDEGGDQELLQQDGAEFGDAADRMSEASQLEGDDGAEDDYDDADREDGDDGEGGGGLAMHPSGSIVGSMMAELNRPTFLGATGGAGFMSPMPQQHSAANSVRNTPNVPAAASAGSIAASPVRSSSPTHSTPPPGVAPSTPPTASASSAASFSPSSYFAARSAPLGSLWSHSKPNAVHQRRPTFNTPPYASGVGGFMGAHGDDDDLGGDDGSGGSGGGGDDNVFVSPKNIGPVLYKPTPGGSTFTSPVSSSAVATPATASRARMPAPASAATLTPEARGSAYSVTVTPAPHQQQPSRLFSTGSSRIPVSSQRATPSASTRASASPLPSFASPQPTVPASASAASRPGLFDGVSPIQAYSASATSGSSAARSPLAPHDAQQFAASRASLAAAATPTFSATVTAPPPTSSSSSLFTEMDSSLPPSPSSAATSAATRTARVVAPATTSFSAATRRVASPAAAAAMAAASALSVPSASGRGLSARTSLSPRSNTPTTLFSPARTASSAASLIPPTLAASSPFISRSPAATASSPRGNSGATAPLSGLSVERLPLGGGDFTFRVQRSSRLNKLHRFAMFEVDPSSLPRTPSSSSSASLLDSMQPLVASYVQSEFPLARFPLAIHSLKVHAGRLALVLVFDVEDPEAARAMQLQPLHGWMRRFAAVMEPYCKRKPATEKEPAATTLSFLELQPARWG